MFKNVNIVEAQRTLFGIKSIFTISNSPTPGN